MRRSILVVAVVMTLSACGGRSGHAGREAQQDGALVVPSPFGYPSGWRTSLAEARAAAGFPLLLPSDPSANPTNVTAVFVPPEGTAVALEFPSPRPPQTPVRQDHIEVWEQPWTGAVDPKVFFADDLAAFPDSAALYDVGGVTALGVTAHASEDEQQMNPAFLRMDVQGVDVQISGGESLDLLLRIANSVVRSASTATPAPSATAS